MSRRSQALAALGLVVAGLLLALAGSLLSWFADVAAVPAGLCFALGVVFLLRATLKGSVRDWLYWRPR